MLGPHLVIYCTWFSCREVGNCLPEDAPLLTNAFVDESSD